MSIPAFSYCKGRYWGKLSEKGKEEGVVLSKGVASPRASDSPTKEPSYFISVPQSM